MPNFNDFLANHPELSNETEDTQYFFYEEYLETFLSLEELSWANAGATRPLPPVQQLKQQELLKSENRSIKQEDSFQVLLLFFS